MKMLSTQFALRVFALWTLLRCAWMSFAVYADLQDLAGAGQKGPYVSVGVDSRFLFSIAAMPVKLIGIIMGFRFGRAGDTAVAVVAAVVYATIAIGIWRHSNSIRLLAVVWSSLELLLLLLCMRYALPSPLLPEFRPHILAYCSIFSILYGVSTICLVASNRKSFGVDAVSTIRN